ncbi:plasmid recombination enzyme, partial [Salmonella enterica subsp. enterica serovar Typhimurium]|uniref:MobV family relaxase n=1 Tax=Salmonella enterica TaxID=28901 RepID=UPI000CBABC34
QRERESNTNPDIDRERTPLNYDVLHDAPINYTDEINKQIEERYTGTRAIRKDAVYLCQFVVTSVKAFFDNLSPKDEKRFFEESAEFLKERYGKENILFAAVHKDEKTPHMHVGMVPITKEGKMSAKAFFGQKHELQSLQTDFHKHVQERGFDLERGEKGSDREHLEAQKYKAQTLEKNIHTLESHLKDVQKVDKHLENITS